MIDDNMSNKGLDCRMGLIFDTVTEIGIGNSNMTIINHIDIIFINYS